MAKQNISVTTDCVIFFRSNSESKILLVKRKKDPFKDKWALPGGFLEDEEPLEMGARRELREETGLEVEKLEQFQTCGTPGRDPRGRIISITFFGEIASEERIKGSDDAAEARWFKINDLPDLAFDHAEIVKVAQDRFFSQNN